MFVGLEIVPQSIMHKANLFSLIITPAMKACTGRSLMSCKVCVRLLVIIKLKRFQKCIKLLVYIFVQGTHSHQLLLLSSSLAYLAERSQT